MTNMQLQCEEMPLLISKYVDDAATSDERETVDHHVAACEACVCKLTEYMEMAAVFSEAPMFVPEAQVREGVFREISRMKEDERRAQAAKTAQRPWYRPETAPQAEVIRTPSFALRFMRAASPFAAASIGMLAVLSLILLNAKAPISTHPSQPLDESSSILFPQQVPTIPARFDVSSDIPGPLSTRAADIVNAPAQASVSAGIRATATLGRSSVVRLVNSTAVSEGGYYSNVSTWHVVNDAAYGYTVSYPPNWWTQVRGGSRYFFPWGPGGTRDAPYYLDLRVEDNVRGLTAKTANMTGECKIVPSGKNGSPCLRRTSRNSDPAYDEIYSFDSQHIYILRVNVPKKNPLGTFDMRWEKAQDVFSRMSTSVSLADEVARNTDYGQVLFLNGTDLWSVDIQGRLAQAITRGYDVRQFALSPDLRSVAFIATNRSSDIWAKYLYISNIESGTFTVPRVVWSGPDLDIHDIAWYSDRLLLSIANSKQLGYGIFRLAIPRQDGTTDDTSLRADILVSLSDTMAAARGLTISPDRQLISFLAPFAENKGTDIYAVRPDGTDLRKLVSHDEPLSPIANGERVLPAENQAVKSYLWTDGRLEKGVYEFNLLYTCGNSSSPSYYRGGYLYSASGATRGPLLDHNMLQVVDPSKLQIIHIAYSPSGKLALTGYYNDYGNRAEQLAGLWTADLLDGTLANLQTQPMPDNPDGIANLQWSPDGSSLVYRETIPSSRESFSSRYDGSSDFLMVRLDPVTQQRLVLYSSTNP